MSFRSVVISFEMKPVRDALLFSSCCIFDRYASAHPLYLRLKAIGSHKLSTFFAFTFHSRTHIGEYNRYHPLNLRIALSQYIRRASNGTCRSCAEKERIKEKPLRYGIDIWTVANFVIQAVRNASNAKLKYILFVFSSLTSSVTNSGATLHNY